MAGLGQHAEAVQSYDEAGRLKPGNLRAAVKSARARSAMGQHREALDQLMTLGRVARRSGLVQKAMGDIYREMGRPDEAAACYRALVLNAPELRNSAPDLAALADQEPPEGAEAVEAYAAALAEALASQSGALAEKVRGNPSLVRDWIASRRDRATG